MICHDFKGGIGTSSRIVDGYTIGVLVQANHGAREDFRVDGVPVGRILAHIPDPWENEPAASSSLIVVVATDAPLLPHQCRRLAQRAVVGMSRVGGIGHNGSGDIFLAFATGNHIPANSQEPVTVKTLPGHKMNTLFAALAEAVEEAILNVLTSAETMTGWKGRTAHALPLDELQAIMQQR
jgi:D-aminopeptidase